MVIMLSFKVPIWGFLFLVPDWCQKKVVEKDTVLVSD